MRSLNLGSDQIAVALRASITAPLIVQPLFGASTIAVPRYAASLTNVIGRTRLADYGKLLRELMMGWAIPLLRNFWLLSACDKLGGSAHGHPCMEDCDSSSRGHGTPRDRYCVRYHRTCSP